MSAVFPRFAPCILAWARVGGDVEPSERLEGGIRYVLPSNSGGGDVCSSERERDSPSIRRLEYCKKGR